MIFSKREIRRFKNTIKVLKDCLEAARGRAICDQSSSKSRWLEKPLNSRVMCEKTWRPETRKITGMEAKRRCCAARMRERREAKWGWGKKREKGCWRTWPERSRASIHLSVSSPTFFPSTPLHISDIPLPFVRHIVYNAFQRQRRAAAKRKNGRTDLFCLSAKLN